MLNLALEMDTGKYTEHLAHVMLYIVRTIIRIEGFMVFLVKHHRWDRTQLNGTGAESFVRGVEISQEHAELLWKTRMQLRSIVADQACAKCATLNVTPLSFANWRLCTVVGCRSTHCFSGGRTKR